MPTMALVAAEGAPRSKEIWTCQRGKKVDITDVDLEMVSVTEIDLDMECTMESNKTDIDVDMACTADIELDRDCPRKIGRALEVDEKLSQFGSVLELALNDLKRGLLQEFVKHVEHVNGPEVQRSPLGHCDSGIGTIRQSPVTMLMAAADRSSDHHQSQSGMKRISLSTDSTAYCAWEANQGRTQSLEESFQKELSMAARMSSETPETPCDRWIRFVRLVITLGRGKFSPLSCWIPATNAPKLKAVLASTLKPIGEENQYIDEIWRTWGIVQRKGIQKRLVGSELGSDLADVRSALSDERKTKKTQRLILHPSSGVRAFWCLCGLFGILYDAAMITLSVFDLESTGVVAIFEWFFRVYWVLDMAVSFRTGFYVKSVYQDSPKQIAKHYLSTWFAFDVIAIVPDLLVTMLMTTEQNSLKAYQFFRYLKLFKILRLTRIAKIAIWAQDYLDSLNSSTLVLSVYMMKYLTLVMCWVHCCACAWYGIAKDAEDGWITRNNYKHMKLPQTYFISLQWACSQLQGSTDLAGSFSASERAFHCAAIMASIFVLAVFISNVTNSLIQLQSTWDDKARQLRALQDYLQKHRVSPKVSESVRKYCAEKLRIERKLQFGEDDVTKMLPKALQRTLLVEVRAPMVQHCSPFLDVASSVLPKSFQRLCCDILFPFFEKPDTAMYHFSDRCTMTYFNVAGQFVYDHVNNSALSDLMTHLQSRSSTYRSKDSTNGNMCTSQEATRTSFSNVAGSAMRERMKSRKSVVHTIEFEKTQPICEAAMWTHWIHCGDMTAASHTVGLALYSHRFSYLVESDQRLQELGVAHAVRWCRALHVCEISDLLTSNDILEHLYNCGEVASADIQMRSLSSLGIQASKLF